MTQSRLNRISTRPVSLYNTVDQSLMKMLQMYNAV